MEYPTFGIGLTNFSVDLNLTHNNVASFIKKLDDLDIPKTPLRRVEILIAHNPSTGIDLDNPDESFLARYKEIGERLRDAGYGTIVLGFHPPGSPDLLSEDLYEVHRAENRVFRIIDCAVALDSMIIAGPFHREHRKLRYDRNSRELIKPLYKITEYAVQRSKKMALEMINCFETNSCNSLASTLPIIRDAHDSLGVHYDTAHAIRQEPQSFNLHESIASALDSGRLYHIHFSAAGRGPLAKGEVVTDQLPFIIAELNSKNYGRNGENANFEGFPYELWNAVAREDIVEAWKMTEKERNELNYRETKQSLDIIKECLKDNFA